MRMTVWHLVKKLFCISHILPWGFLLFSEWLGVWLSGKPALPDWLLVAVKCADYILTPFVGGTLIWHLKSRSVLRKVALFIVVANALFQLVSVLTGWMMIIDEQNRYHHGPLYMVYVTKRPPR